MKRFSPFFFIFLSLVLIGFAPAAVALVKMPKNLDIEGLQTFQRSGKIPKWGLVKCRHFGSAGMDRPLYCVVDHYDNGHFIAPLEAVTTVRKMMERGWDLKQIATHVSGSGAGKGRVSGGGFQIGVSGSSKSKMKITSEDFFYFYKPKP